MAQLMCNFVSYSLRGGVDIAITLPTISSCDFGPDKKPCHTPQAPYPVLYLLHGYGNDYKCWHRYNLHGALCRGAQDCGGDVLCGQ